MSTAAAYTADSVLAGEKIISADSHIMEPDDLWVKNLTPSLKPKYPDFPKRNSPGERAGGWDPKARISEMEVDGVSAEVLYPTLGLRLFAMEDAELSGSLLPDRQRLDDRLLQSDTGALDRHPDDLALQYQERHQGARALQEGGA